MIIGITGTLASGKSTIALLLSESKNAHVLNADEITHKILRDNKSIMEKLAARFGKAIFTDGGNIDRKELGRIVFFDRQKLKALCAIIHPEIIREIKKSTENIFKENKDALVIIDAPLLIESGLHDFCDYVIVVSASIENIINRLKKHLALDEEQALKRIRAQMPIKEKEKYADYIIENNGSLEELKEKAKGLVKKIGTI
ncbi:MAG: dephospho-CoA kinase [Candidatus Omnitrophica bacterium]|nr:dephospho-CoA kinase [Candidatus Omnitrophota bacterium]